MQQDIITVVDFGSKKLSATVAAKGKEDLEILCVKSCKSIGIEKGYKPKMFSKNEIQLGVNTLVKEVRDILKI